LPPLGDHEDIWGKFMPKKTHNRYTGMMFLALQRLQGPEDWERLVERYSPTPSDGDYRTMLRMLSDPRLVGDGTNTVRLDNCCGW